jgi:hypothetical protein
MAVEYSYFEMLALFHGIEYLFGICMQIFYSIILMHLIKTWACYKN